MPLLIFIIIKSIFFLTKNKLGEHNLHYFDAQFKSIGASKYNFCTICILLVIIKILNKLLFLYFQFSF